METRGVKKKVGVGRENFLYQVKNKPIKKSSLVSLIVQQTLIR
jgi:hypothetical protein